MGLETRQTQASRDGGVDCVAFDPRPIFGGKVVIQAKRYKNTAGVSAVRDLFGTMQGEFKGILVTTSGYGQAAAPFQRIAAARRRTKPPAMSRGVKRLGSDDATHTVGGHLRVVEPDTTRSEVAEAHVLTGRHRHARAASAVGPPNQFVRAGAPVVEGANCRHRPVVHVVRKDERDL
jgi:hypothetical protein